MVFDFIAGSAIRGPARLFRIAVHDQATRLGIIGAGVFDWGTMAGNELTFTLDVELVYPDESLARAPK